MNKQNIEQIIRELFRQGYYTYRENYPKDNLKAINTTKEIAKMSWDNRTEDEIERDEQAGVTLQDYEQWCVAELTALKKESIN